MQPMSTDVGPKSGSKEGSIGNAELLGVRERRENAARVGQREKKERNCLVFMKKYISLHGIFYLCVSTGIKSRGKNNLRTLISKEVMLGGFF